MFAKIGAIMRQYAADLSGRAQALEELGAYKSRGKGRAGFQKSKRRVAMDKRDARKRRNILRGKKRRH